MFYVEVVYIYMIKIYIPVCQWIWRNNSNSGSYDEGKICSSDTLSLKKVGVKESQQKFLVGVKKVGKSFGR